MFYLTITIDFFVFFLDKAQIEPAIFQQGLIFSSGIF